MTTMKTLKPMAFSLALSLSAMWSIHSLAAETVGEKAGEAYQDTKKNTKQAYRNMKDKACEMVNGKMECAGQKLKNKAKNAADEVKDKADDVQKSVD